ncbi:outer membrane lipoprotein-sorting protein [Myxococcota bacterium]|nr:outer membrane lipoprotein-sorting protein [Myxococcota bacterium]MBU1897303.1 outer membrane lipoprotein-sorting protein [Myxococcota bacterium]
MDRLYRSESSQGMMIMEIKTPDFERTLKIEVWSKGMDYTLARIHSPRKEKGVSTLKRKNEMWNYLPKIKKTIRIPASMMMGSWMGSDFTNDDLMRESSWEKDYTSSESKEPPQGQICVDFVPKPSAAVNWSKVVTCFDAKTDLPLSQDFYDEKQRKARQMIFEDVKTLDGREMPTKMILKPLLKEGNVTIVRYEEMKFDLDLDEGLFSLTRLQRGR